MITNSLQKRLEPFCDISGRVVVIKPDQWTDHVKHITEAKRCLANGDHDSAFKAMVRAGKVASQYIKVKASE